MALVASWWLVGCAREGAGCTTGLGGQAIDTVWIQSQPERLEVRDRVEVHWWPTDTPGMAIRHAGEGVLEGVSVEMEANTLVIEDQNRCHWVRDLTAIPEVHLHGIRPPAVFVESQADFVMESPWPAGDLSIEGDEMSGDLEVWFHGDSLRLRLPNGMGHARLRGHAKRFSSFRSGFGDLTADDLQADQVLVHHAGVGDVLLRPEGYLFLELAGPGLVQLIGPGVERDIHILPGATGQVIETP